MSFDIALSGIQGINKQLDAISSNIANSSTYGYKSSRANFSSMYAGTQPTGTEVSSLTQSIGMSGNVSTTGGLMDAAIQGRGFFVSRDSSGAMLYSRVGIFSVNKDGYVVDGFGRRTQGYGVTPGSTALGPMGDLTVPTGQIAAQASTKLQYVGNMSAGWTAPAVAVFDKTDALSYNSSKTSSVYDSLGNQHSVTQYFVKTATNQVTVHYTMDGTDLAATTTMDFDTAGQLVNPAAPVALALGTPTGAAALTVNLDYTGTTQFAGDATTTANASDGYASGTLTGVQIAEDGAVMAQYSNGQKQSVGMLVLATFPDEQSLVPVSDTSWAASNASGTPLYSMAGIGMAGKLTTGALEQSNVDITSELVELMTSQRNYQANSKVISAESAMMQALMQAM
ncbi:flagellar hook-basal body complex protein [Noviherbaspirillum cavernae]|uniref:Flagellar hook protein FlgE n=1 Tax=Noviherbaspirillum cavernae TaxID=2320862 RepID=A0A418WVY7_9BURK|nr:flagellar hook-basal body complex protein [Noviherbaspirillum cavernae]RJF96691.1 flagellar hook-basal body complex protein [Noviherbaspirillum cavernae]